MFGLKRIEQKIDCLDAETGRLIVRVEDVKVKLDYVIVQSERILRQAGRLIKKENHMANTIEDILTAVNDESTVEDSLVSLLTSISQQLKDALAAGAGGITVEQQATIDAVIAKLTTNKDKLSAAVTANTPAAGAPETPPTV